MRDVSNPVGSGRFATNALLCLHLVEKHLGVWGFATNRTPKTGVTPR
jgi:hypothetical protein